MEFDAASNLSHISNQSDDIKSTISSISGLSNYQDEFADLKHLVNPDKYPVNIEQTDRDQCSTPVNDSGCDLQYEDRIADLSYQLQSTLKQNEHYKNELYNLEIKFKVKYHDKIENLLQINNKLETELATANEQIQRLITNYATKNEPQLKNNNGFITLEKRYHQLSLENSNLERQFIESNKAKRELENINQKLRIDINESKMKIDTNNVCIKQLKEKISEQFVEIQTLTKINNLTNQKLNEKETEVDQMQNMVERYKKQVNDMQIEKKSFIESISKYRSEIISKTEKNDALTINLKSLENKFEFYQLEALKERERLYKELKQTSMSNETKIEQKNELKSNQQRLTYYEDSIEDLKNEIKSIRTYLEEQEGIIKEVNKENAELLSKFVATQKMLQNKNLEIEEIELNKQQLQSDIKLINDIQTKKNNEIEILKNEKMRLETEIASCKEEKYFVDMSIKTVREQFTMFLSQYKKLKEELIEKNKQILNLQSEKQELFMNNNWKICELEKSKNNEIHIENLKRTIVAKDTVISEYVATLKTLEFNLKSKEQNLNELEDNYKKEIDRYDKVLVEYKEMFEEYQMKIRNLEDTIMATKFLTKDLKDNLNILKSELKKRDMEISDLRNNKENLVNQIHAMTNEINVVKKDIQTETNCIFVKDEETMTCNDFVLDSYSQTENFIDSKTNIVVAIDQRNGTTEYLLKEYKKIFNKGDKEVITDHNNLDIFNISTELNEVSKIDQNVQTEETQLSSKMCEQSKQLEIRSKFQRLLNRVKNLEKSVLECKKNFNTLEIEKKMLDKGNTELKALLQVKTLEMKEQQKKYERNYRTLLRKVREHMKGRKSAEKHNKYLQGIYNDLCEENNSLKLSVSSKIHESDENKKLLTDFMNINEKMKKELRELEKRLKLSEMCTNCVEFDVVKKRLTNLEVYIVNVDQEKQDLEALVMEKDNIVFDFQHKIQELHYQNTATITQLNNYRNQMKEMQIIQQNVISENEKLMKELQLHQFQIEDLSSKLQNVKQLNDLKNKDIFTLKNVLRELEDKLDYVTKEKENLNISFQALTEEQQFLKVESAKKDSFKTKHYEEKDTIIEEIKKRLQEAHRDLASVNNEKFFIQRLCNDLKVALKSYANQNQVLKEKLDNLHSRSRQESLNSRSSLPDLPSLQSFDEKVINNLLQECRFIPATRPITDIQMSLDTLKKEIFNLQEQISRKNLHTV